MNEKNVYSFGDGQAEGDASLRDRLGGKGANLQEMTRIGIPVPPGFTISTEVCNAYDANNQRYPAGLEAEVDGAIRRLEETLDRRFGDPDRPLLVSIRSGARASMPGMMDTVLNLGLSDASVQALAKEADPRFANDCYRRFIQMYSDVVDGVPKAAFDHALQAAKVARGTEHDTELKAADLEHLIIAYKNIYKEHTGREFPQDARVQFWGAVGAVFQSWHNERARVYREMNSIPHEWGTAVNVQSMVFGNLGEASGTGVAFTRDPASGERLFFGEWLRNAQGEDVVAGIRTPLPIRKTDGDGGDSLEESMPRIYSELVETYQKLERHYRDMQDIEFTIQAGELFLLQTRAGKRTGFAAIRVAVDMVDEGLIDREEAIRRVDPEQLVQLLAPTFEPAAKAAAQAAGRQLTKGLPAGPGAACGRIAFTASRAIDLAKTGPVVLARAETSPEDIAGMNAATGILTSRGGMTSHAAVVARGMGKCCVVGAGELIIDEHTFTLRAGAQTFQEGDWISVDGISGEVFVGELPTRSSAVVSVVVDRSLEPSEAPTYQRYAKLMSWADEVRRMKVRTNADTGRDAAVARRFGAEGIGLCRTEHMFFDPARILAFREFILAETDAERARPLAQLLPMQRDDFVEIFRAMDGLPVNIRLLDPPLHEFLPQEKAAQQSVADDLGVAVEVVRRRVESLAEFNPMLGHRGCRLGITHPELYEMQVRAIMEAAVAERRANRVVLPEIMIPLIGTARELEILAEMTHRVAKEVLADAGVDVPYQVGTMIEIPRAALRAADIARTAEFFSFGTNDLTQMTFGYSRDDAGVFLPDFLERKILAANPFATLDVKGVGELVRIACERGRSTRPDLKLGICGEHGGDPASVTFFDSCGLDYVSCSPYRVPIARLAAARATLESGA